MHVCLVIGRLRVREHINLASAWQGNKKNQRNRGPGKTCSISPGDCSSRLYQHCSVSNDRKTRVGYLLACGKQKDPESAVAGSLDLYSWLQMPSPT